MKLDGITWGVSVDEGKYEVWALGNSDILEVREKRKHQQGRLKAAADEAEGKLREDCISQARWSVPSKEWSAVSKGADPLRAVLMEW